jgi:FKBP12-rapamycin complex-associated protein
MVRANDFKGIEKIFKSELSHEPSTPAELTFDQAYRARLTEIFAALKEDRPFVGLLRELHARIQEDLSEVRPAILLCDYAPLLHDLNHSVLAIPGTYSLDTPLRLISHFHPSLIVYESRERQVTIIGSDGHDYKFLLKGQSDLRLDRHVTQFFELVGMHIKNLFPSDRRSLKIHYCLITPLSDTCGLIQFWNDTETIDEMIEGCRKSPNLEGAFIRENFSDDYDHLPLDQKVEILRRTAQEIPGTDLREAIWLRCGNAMTWLSKTLRFVRTTAIMSIIGYIMGLGNRVPSNIMVHNPTGHVIHLDLSSCFEVCQKRANFPESVPFRLTRMIVGAFGVEKVYGEFEITARLTVNMLKFHRESSLALLDIFKQDQSLEAIEIDQGTREDVFLGQAEDARVVTLNITEALDRICQKIDGREFDPEGEPLTTRQQVKKLMQMAMGEESLAKMPWVWQPLW